MWKLVENGSEERPDTIDKTSSSAVVYVRKDFEQLERTDDNGNVTNYWQYKEQTVPKKDWDVYELALGHDESITDMQMVLCDIYETIGG